MDFSFNKKEHLCSRSDISFLIEKGKSFVIHPIKVRWVRVDCQDVYVKCGFSVPKRNFKKAVSRNRIKRLMREAYRLNKNLLYDSLIEKNVKMQILFTFIDNSIPEYKHLESKIILTLQSLKDKNEKGFNSDADFPGKNI